ncbi:hypothetical protein AeMF1_016803 [Aphanomyces euteiches]|nr:hypothetical protein AeMF1_016803 [Aphanomyces euteiches]KAH9196794.1 hypothetical protein AeNC1_001225 [Aphanomyces euteiches]
MRLRMQRAIRNMTTLSEPLLNIHLSMENTAAREGSGFKIEKNPPEIVQRARANVPGVSFTKAITTPLPEPKLVCVSRDAIELLQQPKLEGDALLTKEAKAALTDLISGAGPGECLAHCYAGHQFGRFSGQLGDGAAILLGGVDQWEAQLKGAGLTAFSRTADGRKVLRSTLREFLASEHMHALGIPTTRAGGVTVSSTETVLRDMFYDGNAQHEPCATVLRIAQTFIRFGSFELFKPEDPITGRAGPSASLPLEDQQGQLRAMLSFVQRQYYQITDQDDFEASTSQFLQELTTRTAALVARWQTVGFCHGVLNTDNLSIVGDTLDYGPYGYMEHFNPKHICNTSDNNGRYSYENQPSICKWNLHVLVDQFKILFSDETLATMHSLINSTYDSTFEAEMLTQMQRKLGLDAQDPANAELIASFWATLTETRADFTTTFRSLSDVSSQDKSTVDVVLQRLVSISHTLEQEQDAIQPSVSPAQLAQLRQLLVSNPRVAIMHGITEEAIEAMQKELKDFSAFLESEQTPESYKQIQDTRWRVWLEEYFERLHFQAEKYQVNDENRRKAMLAVNPKYILRNHVAQRAIEAASAGDYYTVAHVFDLLTHPFDEGMSCDAQMYGEPLDPKAPPLLVSCSS